MIGPQGSSLAVNISLGRRKSANHSGADVREEESSAQFSSAGATEETFSGKLVCFSDDR